MTADALAVVKCLFSTVWSIFTSWHIPGTATTPAMWMIFFIVAGIGIRFMQSMLFNQSFSGSGAVSNLKTIDRHKGDK